MAAERRSDGAPEWGMSVCVCVCTGVCVGAIGPSPNAM